MTPDRRCAFTAAPKERRFERSRDFRSDRSRPLLLRARARLSSLEAAPNAPRKPWWSGTALLRDDGLELRRPEQADGTRSPIALVVGWHPGDARDDDSRSTRSNPLPVPPLRPRPRALPSRRASSAPFPPPPPRKPPRTLRRTRTSSSPRASPRSERPDRVHLRRVRGGARGGDRRGRPRVVVGPQRARPARPRRPGQPPDPDRDRGPPEGRRDRLGARPDHTVLVDESGSAWTWRQQARPTGLGSVRSNPRNPKEEGTSASSPRSARASPAPRPSRAAPSSPRGCALPATRSRAACRGRGQLGHGTDHEHNRREQRELAYEPQPTPMRVVTANKDSNFGFYIRRGAEITNLACGHNHCVCTDANGKIWTWGNGGYGRLGHKVQRDEFSPSSWRSWAATGTSCRAMGAPSWPPRRRARGHGGGRADVRLGQTQDERG